MGRIGRNIEYTVDTGFLQCFGICLRIAAKGASSPAADAIEFAAAITHEDQIHFLLEIGRFVHIIQRNAASAEKADVGKLIEVGQGDRLGFHPAHG